MPARNVRRSIIGSARSPGRRGQGRGRIDASERYSDTATERRRYTSHLVSIDSQLSFQTATRASELEQIARHAAFNRPRFSL